MADESRKIELVFEAVDKATKTMNEINDKFGDMQKAGGKTETSVSNLSGAFVRYLGPAAIVAGLTFAIKEAADSEKAIISLQAAVETAGGSWVTNGQAMQDYALNLQSTTTYSDEQVMDVMQRLVTVTGDSEKGWKNAGLALDMASTGMISAEGAARAIAMAEEGNVQALGRLIPELKGAGAEQLKYMSATERSEYAMKLLNEKFGGRAQADAQSFWGQLAQLKNEFSDLAEKIGGTFLPALTEIVKTFKGFIGLLKEGLDNLDKYHRATGLNVESTTELKARISDLKGENKKLYETLGFTEESFKANKKQQGAYNSEISVGVTRSDDYRKAQEKLGNNLEAIATLEKLLPPLHQADTASGLAATKAQSDAFVAAGKLKEDKIKEFNTKYDAWLAKETSSTIEGITSQKDTYAKYVDNKDKLNIWYDGQLAIFNEKQATDNIALLDKKAGSDNTYFLDLLTKEQTSTDDKSLAWDKYQKKIEEVQATIQTKNQEMIKGIIAQHTNDLLLGVIKGNADIQNVWQGFVDDILGKWTQMIADMIAKWATSQLFQGMNINVVGGGGGGGVGGALSGAARGAAIGSVVPVVGNIVGGIIGGIAGLFGWAEGGIITKPTIGMAGENGPEAIIPLDQMDSLGGDTIHVTFQTLLVDQMTTERAAKIIDREINKLKQTDRSILFANNAR